MADTGGFMKHLINQYITDENERDVALCVWESFHDGYWEYKELYEQARASIVAIAVGPEIPPQDVATACLEMLAMIMERYEKDRERKQ